MSDSRLPHLGPRGEGWTLAQVVLMAAIVVAAWRASPTPFAADILTLGVRSVGLVGLLLGLGVTVVGSYLLRRAQAFSALPRPVASGALVEAGPYRLIRHPIYAGLLLAGLGTALYRESWPVAALTLALGIVLDLKRRREEAWLSDRFPGYATYRQRTKALVPFLY